ncbi:MAG TPA: hypothetical protein VFS67_12980 [Polyangiaceae bacterium]|nr:hypothetical protein [Polyangiaceae bacterium]
MTQRDFRTESHSPGEGPEARLARARLAFDQGLREASETGARAARRLLVPALWGAALVGGTLLAIAVLRMARRPAYSPALLRVSIEPRPKSNSVLPAIGGVIARFAVKRLLEAPAMSTGPQNPTLPGARPAGSQRTVPEEIGSHNNGVRPGSSQGRASA